MTLNNLDEFKLAHDSSIKTALVAMERNKRGFLCLLDNERLVAVLTDGDIRRAVIQAPSVLSSVLQYANKNFMFLDLGYSNEQAIKIFDVEGVEHVPVLNEQGGLAEIIFKDRLFIPSNHITNFSSRVPARVSFFGGGSDLTEIFFRNRKTSLISAGICKYARAHLRKTISPRIKITSVDLGMSAEFESMDDLAKVNVSNHSLGLLVSAFKVLKPEFGCELVTESEIPLRSGLGGSSSICIAVLSVLLAASGRNLEKYNIAEMAYHAERQLLGVRGGWQDQYSCAFGGFNLIELSKDNNVVSGLSLSNDVILALESGFLLVNTNISRESSFAHPGGNSKSILKENVSRFTEVSVRQALISGDVCFLGQCLDTSWQLKKQKAGVSNPKLDSFYRACKEFGVFGGKLLGAGGGGFFLVALSPDLTVPVRDLCDRYGFTVERLLFSSEGIQVASIRE